MDSNEKNLDNSLESAMNMTQEEIERFLAQQESQGSNEQFGFDDSDLASLLSQLGEEEDNDIQEISDLLNKADNNEAVAEDIVALMNMQESEGETAYDAMDLFSGEQAEKKEGFFKRLLRKLKEKKKEKKKEKSQESSQESIAGTEEPEFQETVNSSDDSMADALALLSGEAEAFNEAPVENNTEEKKSKKKKEKKAKKPKKEKKTSAKASEEETEEQGTEKSPKKKKDKKGKEKKVKDKEKKPKDEPIREKKPEPIMETIVEEEEEAVPHKKKIVMVFVAAVAILLGFLVVNHYFTGHANKKLAEEAYAAEDYLECYQLLYGQKLNDSQTAMFHRSELVLKMDIFWNHYQEFISKEHLLEGLDKLVQFVYEYPELSAYASEWNCQDTIEGTYNQVVNILAEDYKVSEQEVLDIAALEKDIDYTRALAELVEIKQKNDAIELAYPDILPPEQDRIQN